MEDLETFAVRMFGALRAVEAWLANKEGTGRSPEEDQVFFCTNALLSEIREAQKKKIFSVQKLARAGTGARADYRSCDWCEEPEIPLKGSPLQMYAVKYPQGGETYYYCEACLQEGGLSLRLGSLLPLFDKVREEEADL